MKINSVSNINICNYTNKLQQNSVRLSSPLLLKDTVSFSSRANFNPKGLMSYMPTEYMCERAELAASGAQAYLDKVVGERINSIAETVILSSKQSVPSFEYYSNIKKAPSIREKVVSKYAKISRKEDEEFCNQATDLLCKNLKFKEKVDRNRIYSDVVKVAVEKTQIPSKKPPYKHVSEYVNAIEQRVNSLGIIDYTKTTNDEVKATFKRITEEIQQTSRPDKEENYSGKFYINPQTVKGVKHYANDIVRSRVVMNVPDKSSVEDVFSELENAVNSGRLKIKSIENYMPAEAKLPYGTRMSQYEYIKEQKIKDFADTVSAEYIPCTSETGYMGIHINLDLTNSVFGKKNDITNGYQGEIQLLGRDVMQLKDVEDLCYKLKDNKTSFNEMYMPFAQHFRTYYNDSNKAAFDEYTYALYLYQRTLPPHTQKKKFPSIKELGFNKRVPEQLDFNKLLELKELCERRQEVRDRIKYTL